MQQKSNKFRKKNGFTCPWNIYQILAYFLYIFQIVVYFLVIFPIETKLQMIMFTTLYIALSILVFIYAFWASIKDPTQTMIRIEYDEKFSKSQYINQKMPTIQIVRYCQVCHKGVQAKSKHCFSCNRCCQNFDHHCKYLNNCIGHNNYKLFCLLILHLFLFILLQFIITIIKINEYSKQISIYQKLIQNSIIKLDAKSYNILVITTGIFEPILLILNFQLIVYHIYLYCKGISTYDHIGSRNLKVLVQMNQIKEKKQQTFQDTLNKAEPINVFSNQSSFEK